MRLGKLTATGALVLLTACAPSAAVIQTAIAETQASTSTSPESTERALPINAPEPTSPPRPTRTRAPAITAAQVRSKIMCKGYGDAPPKLEISQGNGTVRIYVHRLYWLAEDKRCEELHVAVSVVNESSDTIGINPLNFNVIDFNSRTYNLDLETFGTTYLEATTLLPGTYASGWLVFNLHDSTPRYLVYADGWTPYIKVDLREELFP